MSSHSPVISSITIYVGLPIFLSGTLGNLLNIRLLWRTRHNPCAFIFLVSSIINCIALFYGLFTRILSVGFDLDWSAMNRIWCKTRTTFSQASFLISLTCTCLASIDRYLTSCREEKFRRLSRLSIAKCAVTLANIFWMLLFIPYLVLLELIPNSRTGVVACALIKNDVFSTYQRYFSFPVYYGFLPSVVLTITGLLTYRNTNKLQQGRQRQAVQKQLTSMMLMQIPIILFSSITFVIFTEYTMFTATVSKSASQVAAEAVISSVFSLVSYIPFACPFFVFLVSSKSFREDTIIFLLCRKRNLLNTNQVQPLSHTLLKNGLSVVVETKRLPLNSIAVPQYVKSNAICNE